MYKMLWPHVATGIAWWISPDHLFEFCGRICHTHAIRNAPKRQQSCYLRVLTFDVFKGVFYKYSLRTVDAFNTLGTSRNHILCWSSRIIAVQDFDCKLKAPPDLRWLKNNWGHTHIPSARHPQICHQGDSWRGKKNKTELPASKENKEQSLVVIPDVHHTLKPKS